MQLVGTALQCPTRGSNVVNILGNQGRTFCHFIVVTGEKLSTFRDVISLFGEKLGTLRYVINFLGKKLCTFCYVVCSSLKRCGRLSQVVGITLQYPWRGVELESTLHQLFG